MNNSRYFSSTPPVVLNLIIINALMLLATELLPVGNRIVGALALFNVESPLFHSYQLVTYMFLHGGFSHLFFNMFALWMFGRTLEYELGSKRFLTYYMVCGVGAGVLQLLVGWLEYRYGNVGMMALMVPTVGAFGCRVRSAACFRRNAPQCGHHAAHSADSDESQVVRGRVWRDRTFLRHFGPDGRCRPLRPCRRYVVGIPAALLLETQRGDPLLIDEQGVLRRLQTRCFPETSEKFAGQRVQRGDADPFGRDGCGHDRNAAGTVRAPGANLDFSGAGVGRSGGLCNHPAGDVVLDHSVAVRALPFRLSYCCWRAFSRCRSS